MSGNVIRDIAAWADALPIATRLTPLKPLFPPKFLYDYDPQSLALADEWLDLAEALHALADDIENFAVDVQRINRKERPNPDYDGRGEEPRKLKIEWGTAELPKEAD